MRTIRAALLLVTVLGCQHAKPKVTKPPVVQEYGLPPDEARFNSGPAPIGPGGTHFIIGGRNPNEAPTVVRPGGNMPFMGP
jgi:hypothetical protein